jgi:thiol-disulfide isomerase/thioredoxin
MSASLQIGPLALPYTLLLVLGAVALGLFVGKRFGRTTGVDIEPLTFRVLMVALVLARIAFVWQYKAVYLDAPLSMLDIRDGGWNAQAGVIAAWTYTLLLIRSRSTLRKPLLAAVGSASLLWIAGSVALLMVQQIEIRLPAITLTTLDGRTTALTTFEGKPTVVNLWATWCPPCQREMPVFQRAQADHPELHFVFVNQGESAEKVVHFLISRNLDLRNVLLDPKSQAGMQFQQSGLPATLFFDAQGRLVDQRVGALSQATLAQRLAALLPATPSQP